MYGVTNSAGTKGKTKRRKKERNKCKWLPCHIYTQGACCFQKGGRLTGLLMLDGSKALELVAGRLLGDLKSFNLKFFDSYGGG
jgi:hypothetical protein